MLLPLAGCGVGAPARPGPHNVGALGPSAPPARSAALRHTSPAAPPPTAQALPLGAAYALAARRSRPSGLALSLVTRSAPSRPSGARPPCGRLAHCAAQAPLVRLAPLRRAAIYTAARIGGASAAFPALRARRGAGIRRLRAGYAGRSTGRQGQGKRRAGGCATPAAALPAGVPASVRRTSGCPALWRVTRPSLSLGGTLCSAMLLLVCPVCPASGICPALLVVCLSLLCLGLALWCCLLSVLLLVSVGVVLRVLVLVFCPVSGSTCCRSRRYKISPTG